MIVLIIVISLIFLTIRYFICKKYDYFSKKNVDNILLMILIVIIYNFLIKLIMKI